MLKRLLNYINSKKEKGSDIDVAIPSVKEEYLSTDMIIIGDVPKPDEMGRDTFKEGVEGLIITNYRSGRKDTSVGNLIIERTLEKLPNNRGTKQGNTPIRKKQ